MSGKSTKKSILSITLAAAMSFGTILSGTTAVYAADNAENNDLAKYYSTNAAGNGIEKTIIPNDNLSCWKSSMIIAQGVANDGHLAYGSESMNAPAQDLYALYGAYDSDNLYLMWEITDVRDAVSRETIAEENQKMYKSGTYPFFIAIDTGKADKIGNNGKTHYNDTLMNLGITFENDFNRLITVYSNNKLLPAIYCGNSGGINPSAMFEGTASGIRLNYADGILSRNIYGIDGINRTEKNDIFSNSSAWTDFNEKGHNSASRDYHYELSVPLDRLGLTADDIRDNGIGVSLVAAGGKSGTDSLPYDVSMHDNVGEKNLEEKDNDNLTCKFARIGGAKVESKLKNTSSASADTITLGNSVTVNCASKDGIGSVQYAVYYKQNKQTTWSKVSGYSSNTKTSITPKASTSYTIRVKAKDESGKIVNRDIPLNVNKKLANTSSLSADSINLGGSVNVTCSSTGGSGTVNYAVFYKQDSQYYWTKVKDYSTTASAKVTPKAATSYTVRVKAKDESGKIVNRDLKLNVKKAVNDPLNTPTTGEAAAESEEGYRKIIYNLNDYYKIARQDNEGYTAPETLPESVDNSLSEYFPPITTQLGSSCSTYATVYYQYTYMYNKYHNIPTTYNNTFSPRFTYNIVNGAVPRGNPSDLVFDYIASVGCVTREYFPFGQEVYNEINNNNYHYVLPTEEEAYRFAANHKIKNYYKFTNYGTENNPVTSPDDSDIIPIKSALADGNVLTAFIYSKGCETVSLKDSENPNINKGVAGEECFINCTAEKGDHKVTIVGYNDNIWADINKNGKIDSGEMGAFKIANSWGTEYNNKGFFWLAYDALNMRSRVSGVAAQQGRLLGLYHITGIKLFPDEEEQPHIFLKYASKTDDRNNSFIYLTGSYEGQEITECIDLYNRKDNPETGYLNCLKPDEYLHFVYDMKPIMKKLGINDFTKAQWKVTFEHKSDNGKSLSISDFYLCDEKNYRIYKPVGTLPKKLSNGTSSVTFSDKYTQYANVYHRGFENDEIRYYFNNQKANYKTANMEKTRLTRGYTHKYVIDLGEYNSAKVYFCDDKLNSDSNNGLHYEVHPGDNFFGNQQYIEKFESSVTIDSKVKSLGQSLVMEACSKGGVAPYRYKYTVTDTGTGKTVFNGAYGDDRTEAVTITDSMYGGKSNAYTFNKAGSFKVTVYSSDYAGNIVTTEFKINVSDRKFNFKSFENKGGQTSFSTDTAVSSVYTAEFDDSETSYELIVFLNNNEYYRKTISANNRKKDPETGLVTGEFTWYTGDPGRYQLILCRTIGSEYAYTELFVSVEPALSVKGFGLTDSSSSITAGDSITLTAKAENGSSPYGYIFSYFRYGKEYRIQDYSENNSCKFKVPDEPGLYTLYTLAIDQDERLGYSAFELWVEPKR